jgi:hypothetical protein
LTLAGVGSDAADLVVQIRIKLNRDGRLSDPPVVLTSGKEKNPIFSVVRDSAVRAIFYAQPFNMFRPENYDTWKEIVVTFDMKEKLQQTTPDANKIIKSVESKGHETASSTSTTTSPIHAPTIKILKVHPWGKHSIEQVDAHTMPVRSGFLIYDRSTVSLAADDDNRIFSFDAPSSRARELGISKGAVLFQGKRRGDYYEGTAYAFSARCKPLPYAVVGLVSNDERKVTLTG